jgi:hypothetical protein
VPFWVNVLQIIWVGASLEATIDKYGWAIGVHPVDIVL